MVDVDEHPDDLAAAIAAEQMGVLSRRQALQAGITARMISRRLARRRWHEVHTGVYAMAGSAADHRRQLWAAVLHAGPGCPIALHTAGRLHRLDEAFDPPEVMLLVEGERRNPPPGVIWRRQVDLTDGDVVRIDGLPVTSIPRTAMDLAADPEVSITRLRRLVESAVVDRRMEITDFAMVLARLRRSGKTGVRKMSQVLDDLGPGTTMAASELERLMDQVIRLAGIPEPSHEHPLPGAWDRPGFVDRCWPEARLVAEADGRRWHTRRQQMSIDHDRSLDAQVAGYQTSRFLWEFLHGDTEGQARRLRAIYEQRLREVGAMNVGSAGGIRPERS